MNQVKNYCTRKKYIDPENINKVVIHCRKKTTKKVMF